MRTLTIIDTFGFLFRSYFALPPLKNHEGFPTGLLTGFANLIIQLHKDYPKDYLIFALDSKSENYRKQIDPNYKAQRPEVPLDLKLQLEVAIDWVAQMGFQNISIEGYEADDVIASISKQASKHEMSIRIISHDKDLYQLINDQVFLFNPSKKEEIKAQECIQKYGIPPSQFIDYQSIVGDSADNIPGIKGIGAKGAASLLNSFKDLDDIYANLDKIPSKRTAKLLETYKDDAYKSKLLVTLRDDLPIQFDPKQCLMPLENPLCKIIPSLQHYDLNSILKKLKITPKPSIKQTQKSNTFSFFSHLLDTNEALNSIIAQITPQSVVSFDTETTSLNVKEAKIVGFSFSLDGVHAYYAPINHNYLGITSQISLDCAKQSIQKIFSTKAVIGHNIKYDLAILKNNFNFVPQNFDAIKDSMILAWLLKSDSLCNLDFLMKKFFGHEMIHYKDVIDKNDNFSQILIQDACKYACEDAAATYQLYFKLLSQDEEILHIAQTLEFPFIQNLLLMEEAGIKIDLHFFEQLHNQTRNNLNAISEEIFAYANKHFNINSAQQLASILFEDLKLPASKKTKIGYSTSEAVLNSLYDVHPIIPPLLKYRELFKLQSTYIEPLMYHALNHKEHRIFTSFMQTGTATGRLSSKNPNLQNIPVKTTEGRKVREGFIAKEGHVLMSLDYSQIELRLLAHFSNDQAMIEAFLNNQDIHLETAKKIFGEAQAQEKRSIAKSINFGLIYGMGPKKLSDTLKIPYAEAKTYIQNYFQSFLVVKDYLKNQEAFILEHGYSQTLLGRKRKFHFEGTQDYQRAAFLREGINAIFQGSAADIIKLSMNKIIQEQFQSKLLIQVHDELIFESPKELANEESKAIAAIMENIYTLRVPLQCTITIGNNWGELK